MVDKTSTFCIDFDQYDAYSLTPLAKQKSFCSSGNWLVSWAHSTLSVTVTSEMLPFTTNPTCLTGKWSQPMSLTFRYEQICGVLWLWTVSPLRLHRMMFASLNLCWTNKCCQWTTNSFWNLSYGILHLYSNFLFVQYLILMLWQVICLWTWGSCWLYCGD